MKDLNFDIQRFTTITNTSLMSYVMGGSSDDNIYNYGRFSNVFAGSGNDYIVNQNNDYSKVYGEDGNDTITNNGRVTIYGGNGNDVIYHDNDVSYIDGEEGDDHIYISGYGSNNTISGGAGDNSIIGNGKSQVYLFYGEGNDTIADVGTNSTLKISSGYSSTKSGNDLIISVERQMRR